MRLLAYRQCQAVPTVDWPWPLTGQVVHSGNAGFADYADYAARPWPVQDSVTAIRTVLAFSVDGKGKSTSAKLSSCRPQVPDRS